MLVVARRSHVRTAGGGGGDSFRVMGLRPVVGTGLQSGGQRGNALQRRTGLAHLCNGCLWLACAWIWDCGCGRELGREWGEVLRDGAVVGAVDCDHCVLLLLQYV